MKAIYIQSKQWRIYYHVLFIAMTFIHSEIFSSFIFPRKKKIFHSGYRVSSLGLEFYLSRSWLKALKSDSENILFRKVLFIVCIKLVFCVLNFLLILLIISIKRNWPKKKAEPAILQNFNSWIIKFTLIQKSHLALGKIDVLVYFIIQELNFCKIAQLFLCFT